jgi:Plasmid replication region DNA-binding N-term
MDRIWIDRLCLSMPVPGPENGRVGGLRAARHAEVGGQSMAGGPAQRRTGGPICQASHAAAKLGRNIRLVTPNKVVGSLGPDGRLKFLTATAARKLMAVGDYPSVHAVRVELGRGSTTTISDAMRRFWKDQAALNAGNPVALTRLPPEFADASVELWERALRLSLQTAQ